LQVDNALLLGVDGGGTRCRARLCNFSGSLLGEGEAGPANIRFGIEESFAAILEAFSQARVAAGLGGKMPPVFACLALAGANDPALLSEFKHHAHPFRKIFYTTDSHAACAGAHGGRDGGIVIIGTGAIGEALIDGEHHRVGGWGFPVSDEGSGAWLGCELVRRVLWAYDGRVSWTPLLKQAFEQFAEEPYAIVRWVGSARPRDFAALAPQILERATERDPAAREIVQLAAHHIEALIVRLLNIGAPRIALSGGLAPSMEPWLSARARHCLVPASAGALSGAVELARSAAMGR
jgi:glucosamine kinase